VDGSIGAERGRRGDVTGGEGLPARLAGLVEREGIEIHRPPERVAGFRPLAESRGGPYGLSPWRRPAQRPVRVDRIGGATGIAGVDRASRPDRDVSLPPAHLLPTHGRQGRRKGPDDPLL